MDTASKIALANEILGSESPVIKNVKRLKNDMGLIERADNFKTILTEDNKELLID